jgi:hypothetical protein
MTEFSRAHPSPRYTAMVELCRRLHAEGDQLNRIAAAETFDGRSLIPYIQPIGGLAKQFRASSILDYGAGKGMAYGEARAKLTDGRELVGLHAIWDVASITLYDPAYPPHSALPSGQFDGVISTDVLEHCPEEDVPWMIAEIFGFARRFVFVSIACYPARKKLPTGDNAHITLKPAGWWLDRLETVAAHRPDVRYFAAVVVEGGRTLRIQG